MKFDWSKTTDGLGKPRWIAKVQKQPDVYLVVQPFHTHLELIISSVFIWPRRPLLKPEKVTLNRVQWPPALGVEVLAAQRELERLWQEEHSDLEKRLLRNLWRNPQAANFELLEIKAEERQQRNRNLEDDRVQRVLQQRKEEKAKLGIDVEEVEKPS